MSIGALVNPVTGPIFAGIAGSVLLVKGVLAVIENRNAIISFLPKLADNLYTKITEKLRSYDNDTAQDKKVDVTPFFKANPLAQAHSDKYERPPITNSSLNRSFRSPPPSLTSSLADNASTEPKISPNSTDSPTKRKPP